jgi:hypothetical protein
MTKKETKAFFKELGYSTSYSGKEKTMYVDGISQEELNNYTLHTDFKIVLNKD